MGGWMASLIVWVGALLLFCSSTRAQELAQTKPITAQATPAGLATWIALPVESRGNLTDYPFASEALNKD